MTPQTIAVLIVALSLLLLLYFWWLWSIKKERLRAGRLTRYAHNPIIKPEQEHFWGSEATFNPAAIITNDGRVHILYRAIGIDGVSRFGYTSSGDGKVFDEKEQYPVYSMQSQRYKSKRKMVFDPVAYPSGGSWGGSEDPRMVKIGDKIYVTFNCFDGWDFIRAAVISISNDDFLDKRWNWSEPLLISPPGKVNKNWVLFPEKIDGKFAILHSINPEIQIDLVENLEDLHDGNKVIDSRFGGEPRQAWDTWVRGVGPPPLKTAGGWLVFYHAISDTDPHKFKLGAMLLDLNNPKVILARSTQPILAPDMWYENEWKPGIVYACGAVIKDDTLLIYYGGGDKFVCVATTHLDEFIKNLKGHTK